MYFLTPLTASGLDLLLLQPARVLLINEQDQVSYTGITTDWHPCTQTTEQPKAFRRVQLSRRLRNQVADLAAKADSMLPATSRTSLCCSIQGVDFSGLQEFLLFSILQPKAQREWLWPITFMLCSSRSTLQRNLGHVHKECIVISWNRSQVLSRTQYLQCLWKSFVMTMSWRISLSGTTLPVIYQSAPDSILHRYNRGRKKPGT